MRLICLFWVLYLSSLVAAFSQDVLRGDVARIIDGDTVDIIVNSVLERVRLAEIDTPEKDQAWGYEASKALEGKILGKTVRVVITDIDRYGRKVGKIFVNGNNINWEMVEEGHAWVYRDYSDNEKLIDLEDKARIDKASLWSMESPKPPWEWRRQQRGN
jgi:micrococcal nuclease